MRTAVDPRGASAHDAIRNDGEVDCSLRYGLTTHVSDNPYLWQFIYLYL